MQQQAADRRWPMDCARVAILVAVMLDVLAATVPARLYLPADGVWTAPPGWPYQVMTLAFSLQAYAALLAASLLPLVAVDALRNPPRWAQLAAKALFGLLVLSLVLTAVLNTPVVAIRLLYSPLVFLTLVPVAVQGWIGALVVIFVLCHLGRSPLVSALACLAALAAIWLGVSTAYSLPDANPKGLVLVIAGLWLWLSLARRGAVPPGAQPWLAALLILWTLPEIVILLPQLAEALAISSPPARWQALVTAVSTLTGGAPLGQYAQTLLILLALYQIGRGDTGARLWPWIWALVLALGLILPFSLWNIGIPAGIMAPIEAMRTGMISTLAAVLGTVSGLLGSVAVIVMALLSVWLVRQPLARGAA